MFKVGSRQYSRLTYALLAIFLGSFGVHKFYQGDKSSGFKYLAFFWTGIPLILGIFQGSFELLRLFKNRASFSDWSFWDSSIHSQPKQRRKQERALHLAPYEINLNSASGEYVSTSTGEVYNTSLTSCTCESFVIEKAPCKHMYNLAYSLDVMVPSVDPINKDLLKEEALKEFSTLSRDDKYMIAYERISSTSWDFFSKEGARDLLKTNLVVTTNDLGVLLPRLTRYELSNVLDSHEIEYKKSASKKELIDICLENVGLVNDDNLKAMLPVPVKLNEDIIPYLGSFRGKYANEYSEY